MFRIKDLLIHAIPSAQPAKAAAFTPKITPTLCIARSCCGAFWSNPGGPIPDSNPPDDPRITVLTPCHFGITRPTECGLAHSTSPRVLVTEVINPAELQQLQAELKNALELSELVAEQFEESLSPQTLEDVELLETQLRDAQEALGDHRKRLGG